MNIQEIKTKLGVQTLPLNQVVTETGERTSWFKHWDNDRRIAVLVHADTLALIKANPAMSSLGLNTQTKQGSQGEYTAITICNYKPADETL
mgnify:FL=1